MKYLIVMSLVVGLSFGAPQQQQRQRQIQRQAPQQQQQYQQQQQPQQYQQRQQQPQQQYQQQQQQQAQPAEEYDDGQYRYDNTEDILGDGVFSWTQTDPNGATHTQSGYIKNPQEQDPKKRIQVIEGSYTVLTGTKPRTVTYIADENGYRVVGDHLPNLPPAARL